MIVREWTRRYRGVLIGALSIVVLLGVGLATYFLGDTFSESTEGIPRVDAESIDAASHGYEEVLRFERGAGEREIWFSEDGQMGLESLSVDQQGRIFIADHPPGVVGRVRRFGPDGALQATWETPAGSTLYTPDGDGLLYVLSKAIFSTETLVRVREDGSIEATYAIPARYNSTSVLRTGADLGITISVAMVDTGAGLTVLEDTFLPIVRDDTVLSELEIRQLSRPGWSVDETGRLVARRSEIAGVRRSDPTTQTVTFGDGSILQVPGHAQVLGISDDAVWLIPELGYVSEWATLRPGWPAGALPQAEVLVAEKDGSLRQRLIVPWSPQLAYSMNRVVIAGGDLWLAVADETGMTIRRYAGSGQ